MKTNIMLITAVGLTLFAAGCKPTDTQPVAGDPNASPREEVKTQDAQQSAKGYTYAQKAEFSAEMRKRIDALNRQMEDLSAKIETSSAATKEQAKEKLQELRAQTLSLNDKLEAAKDATAASWESVRTGVEKGFEELKGAVAQARQWLSDKLAPS